MKVLYFHGFASSPQSAKLVALQRVLGPDIELSSPDLNAPSFENLDFEAMMERALEAARRVPPDVIVGSSLGGIVALELMRRGVIAPLILIAPAIGIGERWASKLRPGDPIEVFNYARNEQALIHRAFFEQMAKVHPESEPPAARVIAFMGRMDEKVPFDWVRGVWESWTETERLVPGSMFIEIAGGDHGLVGYVDMIAREIRGAVT